MLETISKFPTRTSFVRAACFLALAFAVTFPIAAQRDRRSREREWDPTSYVNEIDADKNGYLDQKELRGRMREYIQKQGHDVSKPVSIKRIIKKYEEGKEAKAREKVLEEREKIRTIPKFGTGEVPETVPSFTELASANSTPQGRLEDLYEEDIVKMTRGYMDSMDKNKDGWLDMKEAERIMSYLGEDADKDGNDKLGELELAEALKIRREKDKGESSSRRGRDRRGDRGSRGGDRGSETSKRGQNVRVNATPASRSSSTPKKTTTPRSQNARESAYVDGIFTKYDKDKDGSLSKDEVSSMSSSVRKRIVDVDKDGSYSRNEVTDSLAGRVKPSSSSSESTSKSTKSSSSRDRSSRRRGSYRKSKSSESEKSEADEPKKESSSKKPESSRRSSTVKYDSMRWKNVPIPSMSRGKSSSKGSSGFVAMDVNKNGQVSMSEFRGDQEWTDELAKKFYAKDKNGDGVITADEF